MITEATRACPTCTTILPESGPSLCPSCARLVAPPVAEWPPHLKRWLVAKQMEAFFAPHARATVQSRWEALLRNVIAGRTWRGRMVPRVVDAADAYAVAISEAETWRTGGCPPLFE